MTAFPVAENAHHWWLTTLAKWNRLHAVPAAGLAWERMEEAIDDGEGVTLRTACGRMLALTYAGVVSRFSMPRCGPCCRAVGVEPGPGTPCNEKANEALRKRTETTA